MTDAAIEERDEAVVEAITAGRSLRAVRREFGLTVAEFDQALERCFPLDVAARMRMIRGDLAKLDRLIDEFYRKALKEQDPHAAIVAIKAWERKHDITGAGNQQRIDLTVQPAEYETGHQQIRAAIMRVARPGWKPSDDLNGDSNSGNGADAAKPNGDRQ